MEKIKPMIISGWWEHLISPDNMEGYNQAVKESDDYYAQVLEGLKEGWEEHNMFPLEHEYDVQKISILLENLATELGWDKEND